jgi:hypothetical protein
VTPLFDLIGVICAAVLVRALGRAANSPRGALACVLVALSAFAFWHGAWTQARSLVDQHRGDDRLTAVQALASPGAQYGADEPFLAWAQARLPRAARVFLDCPQPQTCSNALANWITYRLQPRLFTIYPTQAQWVLFYATGAGSLSGTQLAGVQRFRPGFAVARIVR